MGEIEDEEIMRKIFHLDKKLVLPMNTKFVLGNENLKEIKEWDCDFLIRFSHINSGLFSRVFQGKPSIDFKIILPDIKPDVFLIILQ